jgi:hypothetical protein
MIPRRVNFRNLLGLPSRRREPIGWIRDCGAMTDKRFWGVFRRAAPLVTALILLGAGALQSAATMRAAPAGPTISLDYLTTDQAFAAFDPTHAYAPPAVSHFPTGVQYVALYFSFTGAVAHKTTFHVNFLKNNSAVRRGEIHPLDSADGTYVLDLPGTARLAPGEYQAAVYLDTHRAGTTNFWIVKTPTVRSAYLIDGTAVTKFNVKHPVAPAHAGAVKAGVKQVGIYVSYRAAVAGATLGVAVYDQYGRQVAAIGSSALVHRPTGMLALLLKPTSGSYPAGAYRIDLYMSGAVTTSIPWRAR